MNAQRKMSECYWAFRSSSDKSECLSISSHAASRCLIVATSNKATEPMERF